MRLIDADALEIALENSCKNTYETKMFVDFMNYVDESPTIEQSEDCVSRKSVVEWLERCTDDSIEHAIDTNLDFIPSVTPSYNSIKTELKPCEDCVNREDALNGLIATDLKGWQLAVALEAIEKLSPVIPARPSGNWVETSLTPISGGDFNRGYKCSCCDYAIVVDDFNYCPNCGAKMEVEDYSRK